MKTEHGLSVVGLIGDYKYFYIHRTNDEREHPMGTIKPLKSGEQFRCTECGEVGLFDG